MNRFNRSLLAAAVVGGLCGGPGFLYAGLSNNSQSAQRLDEDHWKFPHMHHALESLKEARSELEQSEDIFKGHRQESLDHVDRAIEEVHLGLKEQSDDAADPAALPPASQLDERFPHMHHALEALRTARTELQAADKIFAGHRDAALDHTEKAIKQLEDGIHDAEN